MSEDAKQHETLEANDVDNSNETSLPLEEPGSEYEELPAEDLDDLSSASIEELLSTGKTDDAGDTSPSASEPEAAQGETDGSPVSPEGASALAQLATEVETLRSQLDERTSQYMRIAADFENFRKRTGREKTDLEQRVKRETLSELLPVIDSFDRARSHINPQTDQEENIHNSYQGVYKQLVDCLKRIGVAPMRSKGQPFDPNLHEAVMREPTNEFEEGMVVEELVSGYLLGEQVLRHAMVKVAAPLDSESSVVEEDVEATEDAISE
ncbi:nucleotide exchange factor GrpE [Acaryochloris sp. IP29b_bin.148]|uniref:nucleotide exchange factor GrpE n=1 Tax=Acaryochloris sp. IP29b_bin.148 TaxID=2969218 RepID=UPI0026162102|nr:nucleotide exchange factor GrpE [Acaryochloris sp. IP29b_bin.148]